MKWAPIIALVVVILVWQIATQLFSIPSYVFPAPSVVLTEMLSYRDIVLSNTLTTAIESLLGATLGCIVGFALGHLMALRRWAESVFLPYIVGSNAVPVVAIAPLVALWFGHGLLSKVVVAGFLCFFPIAINTYDGLRDRGGVLKELFVTLGATPDFYFWNLRMPLAVPHIVSGLKVSVVLAVIGAVVAEFVGSDAGLGFGMLQASYSLDTPRLFGYMIVACGLGMTFYGGIAIVEFVLGKSQRWVWAFGMDGKR